MIPIDDEDALLEKLRQKLGPVKKQDERAELERLFGKRSETDEDRLRAKLVKPSVNVGDVVDIAVEKLAFGGEVIGRYNNIPVFVNDLVPGDTAAVRITEVRRDMCRGDVVELRARSSNRVPPRCPLFGECGGCQIQSLVYTAQLHAKQVMAVDVLKRIGGLDVKVRSVIGSPEHFGYRLRTRMHVEASDRRYRIGYHARHSNRIVEVPECPLLAPVINSILSELPALLPTPGTAPAPAEVLLQTDPEMTGVMLHFTGPEPMHYVEEILERCRERSLKVTGVSSRSGSEVFKAGNTALTFSVGHSTLKVSSENFMQANRYLYRKLLDQAIMLSSPAAGDTLLDLYCGSGFFGLAMARFVASVTGLELSATAIADAVESARIMALDNCRFIACDDARFFKVNNVSDQRFSLLIADPPRSGLSPDVLKGIIRLKPAKFLYVSCDPATLARDLKALVQADFRIRAIQPIDLFPHTYHLENLVFMTHKFTGTQAAQQAFPDLR